MGAALCLGAGVCWAQPLADRAPIRGNVVDETGKPVASAVVTVRRQEDSGPSAFWGSEARADAGGRFGFPGAQEGRYFLNVEAPGYAPLANFALNWKANASPLRLELSRLTRAVLHVSRADGTPLSNAPLWIRLRTFAGDTSSTRTSTDASGDAVVPDLAPATYNVFVVAAQGSASLRAAPVVWREGGTRLDVRLSSGASLKITARDAQNQPLGGASLFLFPSSPEEAAKLGGAGADAGENWALLAAANAPQLLVTRDGEGALELHGVPQGRFIAQLSLPGYGPVTREIETQDGQTIEWNAAFPNRRAATLSLLVRGADGKPFANSLVTLRLLPLADDGSFAPDSPFGGALMPDPGGAPDLPFFPSGPGGRVGRTDADGKLRLFPLKAGRYRVFASRPAPDDWLRVPVAREGIPVDVTVALDQTNAAPVQVP